MDEFTELAQKKSVVDYMLRVIADRLIDGETGAREKIICEDVPYRDREVQQRIIQEYSEHLQQKSHELQLEMNKFALMRKPDDQQPQSQPASTGPKAAAISAQQKPTKRGRLARQGGSTGEPAQGAG
jgi:hypothetical protein